MWSMHLFFANAKATRMLHKFPVEERKRKKERDKRERRGSIVSAHKSIATRIISTRVRTIDH